MQQAVMSKFLSFIAPLITAILGRYIEGDIAKCLLFHRWGIEFRSENVKLKDGALDELGLPIRIDKGFLNLLHITITYTFRVEVNVSGFFLLLSPQHSHKHFDKKSNDRQQIAIKRAKLARAEQRMLETEWKFLSSSMGYAELFVRGVLKYFLRNLVANVSDVHIRYQDVTTIPRHSFVFGVTVKKMTVCNSDHDNENDDDNNDNNNDEDEDGDDDDDDGGDYVSRRLQASNFLDSYLMEQLDDDSSDDGPADQTMVSPQSQSQSPAKQSKSKMQTDQGDDDGHEAIDTASTADAPAGTGATATAGFDAELDKKVICKRVQIESLSMYNDIMQHAHPQAAEAEAKSTTDKSDIIWHADVLGDAALKRKFQFIASRQVRIANLNYILKPYDVEFSCWLHENSRGYIEKYPDEPGKWRPNVQCDIDLRSIDLFISTKQIFALDAWSKHMQHIQKSFKYHELIQAMQHTRPDASAADTRVWWQYAIACALHHNRVTKQHRNFVGVQLHLVNFEYRKQRYMELYKRKMRPSKYRYWLADLDATETAELAHMDDTFPFSQIVMFRCLAIEVLRAEMGKRDAFQDALQAHQKAEQQHSYMLTKLFYNTKSLMSAPQESPADYALSGAEYDAVMHSVDFVRQIDETMRYPDNYVECHFGVALRECNVQLKDNENASLGLLQTAMSMQFDIRPNSYLSQLSVHSIDMCLGSKRDLKERSLFESLLTPISAQIDIETDVHNIEKNTVRLYNVGAIELQLNPDIIHANLLKLEKLAHDVQQIVARNKHGLNVVGAHHVVAIEDEQTEQQLQEACVVECHDVLLIKSNAHSAGMKYFASAHTVPASLADALETCVAGYWVVLQSNDCGKEEKENCVFVKDVNVYAAQNSSSQLHTIRLRNILRTTQSQTGRHSYMKLSCTQQLETANNTMQWVHYDTQKLAHYVQTVCK